MHIQTYLNNLLSSQHLVSYLFWLLTAVGLLKVTEKCGQKSFLTFIPGLRYLPLGRCANRRDESYRCVALEIVSTLLVQAGWMVPEGSRAYYVLIVAAMVFSLVLLIYMARVIDGLRLVFGKSRVWLVLWIFFPAVTALLWGFGSKYQPVRKDTDTNDDLLAGTVPADIDTDIHIENLPADEGLHIHIMDRQVKDGSKTRYLLKDINLAIPNRSLVLLLGGSGSGKTTFVNAVNGYEKANAVITLNGINIYENYDKMKYRLGFVPQQELMRMNDTVLRTISDAAMMRLPVGTTAAERRQKVDAVMDTLGLTAGKDGLVAKKSGGMKKRISIAMELVSDPDLFILDEPDSGLDGVIARELFEKLRSIADEGKIVLVITHTPDRVVHFFDKVIVLGRDSGRVGRLAFYGSPDEARAFFGKNTMEEVVMSVNRKDQGGEGRADEFIARYAALVRAAQEKTSAEPAADTDARKEEPDHE